MRVYYLSKIHTEREAQTMYTELNYNKGKIAFYEINDSNDHFKKYVDKTIGIST